MVEPTRWYRDVFLLSYLQSRFSKFQEETLNGLGAMTLFPLIYLHMNGFFLILGQLQLF